VLTTCGVVTRVKSAVVLIIAVGQRRDALTSLARIGVAGIIGWAGLILQRAFASGWVADSILAIVGRSALRLRGTDSIITLVNSARILIIANGNLITTSGDGTGAIISEAQVGRSSGALRSDNA